VAEEGSNSQSVDFRPRPVGGSEVPVKKVSELEKIRSVRLDGMRGELSLIFNMLEIYG
jgi:hypothetical protein